MHRYMGKMSAILEKCLKQRSHQTANCVIVHLIYSNETCGKFRSIIWIPELYQSICRFFANWKFIYRFSHRFPKRQRFSRENENFKPNPRAEITKCSWKVRTVSCDCSLRATWTSNITEVNGLLVHITTSEGVKANVIIVPSIDVTARSTVEWGTGGN